MAGTDTREWAAREQAAILAIAAATKSPWHLVSRAVAVVGTRLGSPEGLEIAERLAAELCEHDDVVLSG